jgi:acyl carrier protein
MNATVTKTTEEIRATLLAVLRGIAPEADPKTLDPGESLRDQLDLDSMDFLNFVIGVHERLGVEIPEADYPRLATRDACAASLAARAPQHA